MIDIYVTEIMIESSEDHKVVAVIGIASAMGSKAVDAGNREGLTYAQLPTNVATMKLLRMLKERRRIDQSNTSTRLMKIIETNNLVSLFEGMAYNAHSIGVRHRHNEIIQKKVVIDVTWRKED